MKRRRSQEQQERNEYSIDIPLCFTDFDERVNKKTTTFPHTTHFYICSFFSISWLNWIKPSANMLRWVLGEFLNIAHSSPRDGKWTSVEHTLGTLKGSQIVFMVISFGFNIIQRLQTIRYTYLERISMYTYSLECKKATKRKKERMKRNRAWFWKYCYTIFCGALEKI